MSHSMVGRQCENCRLFYAVPRDESKNGSNTCKVCSAMALRDSNWNDAPIPEANSGDYIELQQQMNELQTELFNERQKSKELTAQVAGYEDTIKASALRLQAGDVVIMSLRREFFQQTETHEYYRQGILKLLPAGVHAILVAEGADVSVMDDELLVQLGLVRMSTANMVLAQRIAVLEREKSDANSAVQFEMEMKAKARQQRDEVAAKLTEARASAAHWEEHCHSMTADRDALAVKLLTLEADVLDREADLIIAAPDDSAMHQLEPARNVFTKIGTTMKARAALARAKVGA